MTPAKERAIQKQTEKRKGQHQCNLHCVKPEFTALLAEMRPGYSSNEACLHAALVELKRVKSENEAFLAAVIRRKGSYVKAFKELSRRKDSDTNI